MIHGLIKVQGLFGILKKVDLVVARDQMAKPNPDETYQHPFAVQRVEQLQYFWDEGVVCTCVGNP